ncbi:MAG: alpha-amylase [Bacteroidaceae bacterium]|nr:alpha-amylase [Bacteroidaceae bacterium]
MQKIILYQIFTRLFGNDNTQCIHDGSIEQNGCGKLADFTPEALEAIKQLGTTHVWYTGVIEHATQTDYSNLGIRPDHKATVKGKAGSPYAIKDYYDIDPDLATNIPNRMKEFTQLVKRTHDAGLKMIIDFVPNHVARCYHSDAKPKNVVDLGEKDDTSLFFSPKNNFYYLPGTTLGGEVDWQDYTESPARATGNNRFDAYPTRNDWYETVKLNYGVNYLEGERTDFYPFPSTWLKMRDILLFWAKKGVDGFRCDMAEMVPFQFWGWVIPIIKEKYPHIIFIAEVYNTWEYYNYVKHGKFDYLYDKVGLYDTLIGIIRHQQSATDITRTWQNLGELRSHMLHFMENHDEQRLASDFIVGHGRPALPAMLVSATIDTCPTMVYFGQELGERGMDHEGYSGRDGRTTIFDYWSVDTVRRWRDGGTFSGKELNEGERDLQACYSRLLHIARDEKAITDGDFFDLMYVNPFTGEFNPHRHYAFLRKHENELMLIVANFDEWSTPVSVNIPSAAFSYFNLPTLENVEATELLTGDTLTLSLIPDAPVRLTLPGWSGVIVKIMLPESK